MEKFISRLLLWPIAIPWNLAVIALTIAAIVAWWGLLFGSVIVGILILIFAPDLLFLPLALLALIIPLD